MFLGDLIDILTLHMHIHGSLAVLSTNTCHTLHLCVAEIVLVGMGFIYEKIIHAQFLENDGIVFLFSVIQIIKSGLKIVTEYLHLL